jgi:phosphopantothenoylcysteine synthetase/decarboxylase
MTHACAILGPMKQQSVVSAPLTRKTFRTIVPLILLVLSAATSLSAQINNNRTVNTSGVRLQIERAIYGYNGKGNDVTNRVRAEIRNNQINMQVTNDTMGGDPNHGNKKNLKVVYTYGSKHRSVYVNEKDWLRIP